MKMKGNGWDHARHIVKVPNTENDYFLKLSISGKSTKYHLISAWYPEREMHEFPLFLSDFRKMHDLYFKHFRFSNFQEMHGFPLFLKESVLEL